MPGASHAAFSQLVTQPPHPGHSDSVQTTTSIGAGLALVEATTMYITIEYNVICSHQLLDQNGWQMIEVHNVMQILHLF